MINEKDLAKLSYRGAPKIVSEGFPGAKTQEYLQPQAGFHSWRPRYHLMEIAQAEKNYQQAIEYCEELLTDYPEGILPSGFHLQAYLSQIIDSGCLQ